MLIGSALLACGAQGDPLEFTEQPAQSVEELLDNLPQDPQERSAALDEISAAYPNDPRVIEVLDQEFRDTTPGLLRKVEVQEGHSVSFIEPPDGGLMILEQGQQGQQSVIDSLGLGTGTPAELWAALVQDAPVPQAVLEASEVFDASEVSVPEPSMEGAQFGQEEPPPEHSVQSRGEVGSVQQAVVWWGNANQFEDAGGCSPKYAPSGRDLSSLVGAPMCVTNQNVDMWGSRRSVQVRYRVAPQAGSFMVTFFKNGNSITSPRFTAGNWGNAHFRTSRKSRKIDCGWFCSSIEYYFPTAEWRFDVTQATNDLYHMGAVWSNDTDFNGDTQPWQ